MNALEKRKMMAEFAYPMRKWQERSGDVVTEIGDPAKHYESDPAAACSLLPKLVREARIQLSQKEFGRFQSNFDETITRALFDNDVDGLLYCIFMDVKEILEAT